MTLNSKSNTDKAASDMGIQVEDARIESDIAKRAEPLGFEAVEF